MKIQFSTRIEKPVDVVWHLLAEDFSSIHKWSNQVASAQPLVEGNPVEGCDHEGRICTFNAGPEGFHAKERITRFDAENHRLEFVVEPIGASAALPLKKNNVVFDLRALDANTTEFVWTATPELKAHGYALYPLLKVGLLKSFKDLAGEFKVWAEGKAEQSASPTLEPQAALA
jgi:hypothetical protein